jgi:hypothetical protein
MPIRTKLFLSHFLAVLLVSGSIGTYFYKQATASLLESLRSRLRYTAGLLARTIDAGELAEITGRIRYFDTLNAAGKVYRAEFGTNWGDTDFPPVWPLPEGSAPPVGEEADDESETGHPAGGF